MTIRAVVFDAYGTLFDVYAITDKLESFCAGQGNLIAQLWRDKQIEYARLVSLCDPNPNAGSRYYESFWSITTKALDYALRRFGVSLTAAQTEELLNQYHALDSFTESTEVLRALKQLGLTTAIFSNGDPGMLGAAVARAALGSIIDRVISVDQVGHFKTMPQTYALVEAQIDIPPMQTLFVSGNGWDVLGAQWFGFQTCWINRAGLPVETLGPQPHHTGPDLTVVLEVVAKVNGRA